MLKSVYNSVAQRKKTYESLKKDLARVDGDKIATLLELDECFFEEKGLFHRGCVGAEHLMSAKKLEMAMAWNVERNGMFLGVIQTSDAHEKTKKLLEEKALMRLVFRTENRPIGYRDAGLDRALAREMKKNPQTLPVVYVGDYLDHVEKIEHLHVMMAFDVLVGNADKVRSIIQDLNAVPDYRDYFKGRPPRPRHKKVEPKRERSLVLNPVWSPA